MLIEIWSDIACPFCYIGKRKLEKAIQKDDENLARNYEKLMEDANFFSAYEKKKKDLENLMEDWENVQMEIEDFV